MKNLFARFVREEVGQDLIEYALLASLIAVVSATAIAAVGTKVTTIFESVDTALTPTS